MAGVRVLVGTTKGLFILESEDRKAWCLTGPHCAGWPINHAVSDPGRGVIWAGGGSGWHGAGVWRSEDDGATWDCTRLTSGQMDDWASSNPEVARLIGWQVAEVPFGKDFEQIWSLNCGHGRLLAGAKPAQLLESTDGGRSWSRIDGLTDHPSRPDWNGGAAGLVLHSIVVDPRIPQKIWVGISAAGVFATEDGGRTWERRNRLSNAQAHPHHDHPAAPKGGETGLCIHNLVRAPGDSDLMYQQNHHGVFRSSDGGRNWDDATGGLPSSFGFPIAVHPRDRGTIWTLPLNGDTQGRFPPEASAAVWRSRDGGATWAALREGLPQRNCFFTVLRQAMSSDTSDPVGVYFGTNSGSVFATRDEGETWHEIARHLPTVLAVEAVGVQ